MAKNMIAFADSNYIDGCTMLPQWLYNAFNASMVDFPMDKLTSCFTTSSTISRKHTVPSSPFYKQTSVIRDN